MAVHRDAMPEKRRRQQTPAGTLQTLHRIEWQDFEVLDQPQRPFVLGSPRKLVEPFQEILVLGFKLSQIDLRLQVQFRPVPQDQLAAGEMILPRISISGASRKSS